MKSVYTHKSVTWIDLLNPTKEEVMEVSGDYELEPAVSDDLLSPSVRHKVEFGSKHAYLVLHFPAFKDSTDGDAGFELDFVIGEDFLITAHYGPIEALDKFSQSIHNHGLIKVPVEDRNIIFFGIMKSLLNNFADKLSRVDHWIRATEKQMFEGHEKQTIVELSEASRHLIDFKKITSVYRQAFAQMKEKGTELFGVEFGELTEEIISSYEKEAAKLETLAEAVKELRETNASLLSTKQNETMKILTTVTIVATVIVGIALVWVGLLAVK